MRSWVLCLVFCFFASVSHSVNCIDNATSIILTEQGALLGVVIMFTVLLVGIAYAAGTSFHYPNMIVFAKDEAYHLGFSIVLLVFFSVILLFSCTCVDFFYQTTLQNVTAGSSSTCYTTGADMAGASVCYIGSMKTSAERLTDRYISQYVKELMDSTFTVSIAIPLMNSYTSASGAYRRVVANQYDTIANMFLIPSLVSLSMQELFLRFLSDNVIRWLLPLAFLMRVFIPTRQMGNMLIALSIGLYIILPFFFVFNLSLYGTLKEDCHSYLSQVDDNVAGGCGDYGNFWDVALLIPQAFFLPNLAIAFLITFLSGINKALRVIG